jgi:hypothetical protein
VAGWLICFSLDDERAIYSFLRHYCLLHRVAGYVRLLSAIAAHTTRGKMDLPRQAIAHPQQQHRKRHLSSGDGVSQPLRVLAIKHWIGWSRIAFASVRTCDFLQDGKAAYRYRGFFPMKLRRVNSLIIISPEGSEYVFWI